MNMSAQNEIGFETIDPFAKEAVAQQLFSGPADTCTFRWFMMTPDPSTGALGRFAGQEIFQSRHVTWVHSTRGKR